MSKFVVEYDGTPSVSHTIIAQNTNNEARSVRLLIENHLNDFEEFGVLSFEMTKPLNTDLGGRPSKIYYLNEPQATLLLTYLQNTPIVREFKKALVKEFYQLRDKSVINKEQNFSQALNLIASAMQTMLNQNSTILELLKQKNEPFSLCDKPTSRVYHKRLSNEEKFIEKVIAVLKKEEGIKQGELLARVGTYKNNRSALNWLHSYDGIYWRANLLDAGKYTYSYSLIEE